MRWSDVLLPILPLLAAPVSVRADDFLDDVLLPMRAVAASERREHNITELRDVGPGGLGQTFKTSADAVEFRRIAVFIAHWSESWAKDETLRLTVYDGPDRKTKLASDAIPWARRGWEGGTLMFSVRAAAEPSRAYYFELTVEGGNGMIAGVGSAAADYADGEAFVDGKRAAGDLWFEVHAKVKGDADAAWASFFDQFDPAAPGLDRMREHVAARRWREAGAAMVRHFESREDLLPKSGRGRSPVSGFNPREADLACEQKHLAVDEKGWELIVDLGPDWNYYAWWPTRGGVGLTRSGLRKALAAAYRSTGDEKYARAFDAMIRSMLVNEPCPLRTGVLDPAKRHGATFMPGIAGGSMWASLSLGARMGHETLYDAFADSSSFAMDTRVAWFVNLVDMANVLERLDAGGNWTTQNATALFQFALRYPELKRAKAWLEQGWKTTQDNLLETVHPDGPLHESSINYHNLCMGRFAGMIEKARTLKLDVPAPFADRVGRMYDFVMYSTLPDGSLPIWGNTNPPCGSDLLERGAALFDREDLLWVATQGKRGRPPAVTSKAFLGGGYVVMRDRWAPDAHVLALHNGHYDGHGHRDFLGIVVSAFGRNILVDPGVYTYGTPQAAELTKTRSHNTITVDGQDCRNAHEVKNAFATGPGMDVYDGANMGYEGGLQDVRQRRRILFVKDDAPGLRAYWVMADSVSGEGAHTAQSSYHFGIPVTVTPDVVGASFAAGDADAGLIVRPVRIGPDPPQTSLARAIAAAGWEKFVDAPVLTVTRAGDLPARFAALLLPFRGAPPADVSATADPDPEGDDLGVHVRIGDRQDIILFGRGTVERNAHGIDAAAAAVALRLRDGTAPVRLTWWNGRSVTRSDIKTAPLPIVYATAETPLEWLDARWEGDALKVMTRGEATGLKVGAFGAKRVSWNGGEAKDVPPDAETVSP